jgi:hypothetical protein
MENQANISAEWPLDESRLIAAFKVNDISIDHHRVENPYYQIGLGGFLLDSMGGVLFADVQMSADDGDNDKVAQMKMLYTLGSIHWLECDTFSYGDRTIHIYNPLTKLVPAEHFSSIDSYFPIKILSNQEPDYRNGEFYFAGDIFIKGKGRFHGFRRP